MSMGGHVVYMYTRKTIYVEKKEIQKNEEERLSHDQHNYFVK